MEGARREGVFCKYLQGLRGTFARGDARKESFYQVLSELIQDVALAEGRHHIQVTALPRPTEAGNPDFRVWDGTSQIVGYIGAKPPTEERLDRIEESEQLRRYQNFAR